MTCPRCKCPECRKTELNAVLSRCVSRETSVEELNAQALRQASEQSAWRDTFQVDADAEQLARAATFRADVVREQVRVGRL